MKFKRQIIFCCLSIICLIPEYSLGKNNFDNLANVISNSKIEIAEQESIKLDLKNAKIFKFEANDKEISSNDLKKIIEMIPKKTDVKFIMAADVDSETYFSDKILNEKRLYTLKQALLINDFQSSLLELSVLPSKTLDKNYIAILY